MEAIRRWPILRRLFPDRVRTPTILQMEAVECGAASLAIILAHFGRWVPLTELRRACGVSRDGSQATYVLEAARRYGLEANAYATDLADLPDVSCPYVVFWNFNHFLVVEGITEDRVYLNDPACGPRSVTLQEFNEGYTGIVLYMQPRDAFRKGGHRPRVLPALYARLKGSLAALLFCVLLGFLLVLPGLAVPVFSQIFVDNVLVERMHTWLRPLVLGLALTALLRGVLSGWQLRMLRALKMKLAVVLSSRFLWFVLRLPISYYAQRYAGEISSRVDLNSDVAAVLSGRMATTVIDLFMIVFYAVVMFYYDSVLASIGMACLIVNLLALQAIARGRTDTNARLLQEQGRVNGLAIAGLQGIETLKASGLESDFFSRWAGVYANVIGTQQQLGIANQTLSVLPALLSALTGALVLIIGGVRVMNGYFTIGMLVAFQSLMQSFQHPLTNLLGLGAKMQELRGSITRLDDVFVEKEDPGAREGGHDSDWPETAVRLRGGVELRHVSFGYSSVSPPLIEDLSVTLAPGQRVAFVGPSGSGKSTIARLVCGLYEPWQGAVFFDGQPRSAVPRLVLNTSVAMVEQDIFLFEGTVRDNLTLWCSEIPEWDLVQACKDACIYDDILLLPGGYDAQLEEGARNLSGGQRQRLEIARALVNNPSVLVLDEATSALDAETERLVDQNLRRRGCSCIIIAHRLSTIRDCDEIVVLRDGKVVERGSHSELLAQHCAYAELMACEGEALTTGAGT